MRNRSTLFLLLVIAQGLHSIEEYIGRLWEVFAPARFMSGLVSDNLELGFIIFNIGLFAFGMVSWWLIFKGQTLRFPWLLWCWAIVEFTNGVGHPFFSLIYGMYMPGTITAPILLALSVALMSRSLPK